MATRRGGASWRPSPPAGKPRRGSLKGSFTSWAPLLACLPRRLAPRTEGLVTAPTIHDRCIPSCLLFRTAPAFSFTKNIHQHYLQPPFVEPMCVSGHCTPQPRFSSAIVWGAYDMWMLRGSRAWSQWGVVHRFHVLLACRKFWLQPRRCLDGIMGQVPGQEAESGVLRAPRGQLACVVPRLRGGLRCFCAVAKLAPRCTSPLSLFGHPGACVWFGHQVCVCVCQRRGRPACRRLGGSLRCIYPPPRARKQRRGRPIGLQVTTLVAAGHARGDRRQMLPTLWRVMMAASVSDGDVIFWGQYPPRRDWGQYLPHRD
jgi:hypothetical protein